MKKIRLVVFFSLCLSFAYAQNAIVRGKFVNDYFKNYNKLPIKIYLYNAKYSDSAVMDHLFGYEFKDVPYGVYSLRTSVANGEIGIKNFLLTNISIKSDFSITTFPDIHYTTCEPGIRVYGSQKNKLYYNSGELFMEGNFKKSHVFFKNKQLVVPYYKKDGIWTTYYKSGEVLSKKLFKNDKITSFTNFYRNGKEKLSGKYSDKTLCKTGDWKYFSEAGDLLFDVNFDDRSTIQLNYGFFLNYIAYHSEVLDD